MTKPRGWFGVATLAVGVMLGGALASDPDDGVIRLRPSSGVSPDETSSQDFAGPRRGFDYDAFVIRLESLWFQRKTLLADGRVADAARQSQAIRDFSSEEGVRRLEHLAGALVAESERMLEQGHHNRALEALALAEAFDPGRAQVHMARARVYFGTGTGRLAAVVEAGRGLRAGLVASLRDMSLFNRLLLVLVVALITCVVVFSGIMVARYHVPFRHEIEEWVGQVSSDRWAAPAGWAVLVLPLLLWVPAGWIFLYWILITFRFMRRGERLAAVALVLATALAVPAYRVGVSVYGMTADPEVRTTLASADGEYDPDRILKLRLLVQSHPADPVYRFLLAGLYKNGRYFEEALTEYREALELNSALDEAYINIGNIFFTTGQHGEAIAHYRRALEIDPQSLNALFNLHLAQSESFRFREAEETLNRARDVDSKRLADLFAAAADRGERPTVIDSTLQMASVWDAAIGGAGFPSAASGAVSGVKRHWLVRQALNPLSVVSVATLLLAAMMLAATRRTEPARRCIRCGRPFCQHCRSGRDGHEYCSQCHHLFVLGDGLAPETKQRKVWEVERHERWTRVARALASVVLPGSRQLLRGRALLGVIILLTWVTSLLAWRPELLAPFERATGLDVGLQMLTQSSVPALYDIDAFGLLALVSACLIWLTANVAPWKRGEA